MKFLLVFTFCSVLLNSVQSATVGRSSPTSGCQFKMPNDVPENEPVYLLQNGRGYEFYDPEEQTNFIPIGQSLQLFCPGSQNVVQIVNNTRTTNGRPSSSPSGSSRVSGQNMTQIQCNQQSKFEVNSTPIHINRMNCTKSVMGDILTTRRRCGPRSEAVISQLGFRLNSAHFMTLIEACFNNRTASSNFVKYKINGKSIRYNVKESERRSFRETGLPSTVKANDAYKKASQLSHFNGILGSGQNFFNNTSFLSRGHLAADADFVFSSGQFATYFYVNVAPQFQAINGGNWLRVENIARNLAMNYATDLIIYSGTLGQLKLPSNGKSTTASQRALYLHSESKIIVPLYFYKIIVDERTNSAIVFVTYNNPFLNRVAVRPFCEDVCQRSGLDMKQFPDIRKGYTFCCEYNAFMQQVDISPFSHTITKILSCANIILDE